MLQLCRTLLLDRRYFWLVAVSLLAIDALFTQLIVRFVPYTEIDWETYMIHIDLYLKGGRDYASITGPTGPLVYPAGHVYIHNFLHYMTSGGQNIRLAQHIYGALYLLSQLLVFAIYRHAGAPNWSIIPLIFSKRLHSIYTLRLFNDCWSVAMAQGAILAFQNAWDTVGMIMFSAALSVKMSVLLYLPGLLVVLLKRNGVLGLLRQLFVLGSTQALLGLPFLQHNARSYLSCAFDLSRVFMYKWTVNWRMLDEAAFLSRRLAISLLLCQLCTLGAFALFRWYRRDGGAIPLLRRALQRPTQSPGLAPSTPDYVATVLMTSNLVGIVFSRSLHYQFYSWYAQQVPLLTLRTRLPGLAKLVIIGAVEYAWNIFPSTPLSSSILLVANSALLLGIYTGYPEGKN